MGQLVIRIIGGMKRGLKLHMPPTSDIVRPTSDKLRGAIFNILLHASWAPDFKGLAVLDVFAGTGALGLEALSRGAAQVNFIENNPAALGILKQNITRYGAGDAAKILQINAVKPVRAAAQFDLVFLDPPYGQQLGHDAVLALQRNGWTHDKTLFVIEMATATPENTPQGFTELDRRSHGKSTVAFWRLNDGF